MNLPAHQRYFPRLAPELVRPKFWEVALDARDPQYITPFQKIRIEKGFPVPDLARAMGMEIHDYTNFENGFVHPHADDIIRFCVATKAHPLDLYRLTAPDIPLPREIVSVLMNVAGRYDFSDADRRRAAARLQQEIDRAYSMVHEHSADYQPMFMALGISPGSNRTNAPLYVPADFTDAMHRAAPEDVPTFITIMRQSREKTPRGFIECCLNAYQLMLEADAHDRRAIDRHTGAMHDRALQSLARSAADLFGEDGKQAGADNMLNMIRVAKDLLALKSRVLNNPSLVGEQRGPARAGVVLAFFTAATHQVEYERLCDRNHPAKRLEDARLRLEAFLCWRDRPQTQRMIDWFENWLVLKYIHGGALNITNPHPQNPQL